MMEWVSGGAVVAIAIAAVWFDVREGRIPNMLTVTAFVLALLVRSFVGWTAIGSGLAAAALCFLVALPFFLVRGLGGGDVKLLTAFGAFLGLEQLAPALLVTALAGGVLALIEMVRRQAVGRTLWGLYAILRSLGPTSFTRWKREEPRARMTLDHPDAVTVPYGIAISAGALYGWFL
jgi:prepilin peptidase CpaA